MESKLENLYRSMILLHAMNFKKPKVIKVTSDFYNCLTAKYKDEIYFVNLYETVSTYFAGVLVVIDNTIDGYYELEF